MVFERKGFAREMVSNCNVGATTYADCWVYLSIYCHFYSMVAVSIGSSEAAPGASPGQVKNPPNVSSQERKKVPVLRYSSACDV